MSWLSRLYLLACAVSATGMAASLIIDFSSFDPTYHGRPPSASLFALSAVPSLPFWLPAIIPNRFQLLSRIVRWICACPLLVPIWLAGTAITHNFGRWAKGWEAFPSVVVGSLLGAACCVVAIAVLVWPEASRWLKRSTAGAPDNQGPAHRPIWGKVIAGLLVSLIAMLGVGSARVGYAIYDRMTSSVLLVRNWSGSDVRFQRVTIDGRPIWGKPNIVVKTIRNLEKPWLDTRGDSVRTEFRAPNRMVELELVTIDEKRVKETVLCRLDNRVWPRRFVAYYLGGRMAVQTAESDGAAPPRGPHGEFKRAFNSPPEWPKGPYPLPIR